MKTKSALSYFGSDSEVAGELAGMLDHCSHVTIPFIGGGSILPHLKARAIVGNDLHDLAITFYRVMSGCMGESSRDYLITRCQKTLSHPAEMDSAYQFLGSKCDADAAWAFWTMCWLGRKGKGGTKHMGGTPSVRWSPAGGTNATRLRAAAGDLESWAKEFERCEWLCQDFRDVLPKVNDKLKCGIYCDPPWVGAGRNYLHAFSEIDHQDLRDLLGRFRETTVVVRYGDHPLIRELYSPHCWTIVERQARNQANGTTGEIWITNREST